MALLSRERKKKSTWSLTHKLARPKVDVYSLRTGQLKRAFRFTDLGPDKVVRFGIDRLLFFDSKSIVSIDLATGSTISRRTVAEGTKTGDCSGGVRFREESSRTISTSCFRSMVTSRSSRSGMSPFHWLDRKLVLIVSPRERENSI